MDSYAPPLIYRCCLCGSTEALSGEHKIKASALRSVFGDQKAVIVRDGGGFRHAQSSRSKAYHFQARVCVPCNSARTRPADLAFDEFHAVASHLASRSHDPADVTHDPRFRDASGELYLDVFRYFAKLMCCHLAEMGAPFEDELAAFAIGLSDRNIVELRVDTDEVYKRLQNELSAKPYAAHGGLIVTGDKDTLAPTSFYSTLTVGPVRYCFRVSYSEQGQANLMHDHPEFYDWCTRKIADLIANPLSADARQLLGLPPHPDDLPPEA